MSNFILLLILLIPIQSQVSLFRQILLKPQTAMEILETEIFDQNCEKFHQITQTLIITSKEPFLIVNLHLENDVPETAYKKYCQQVPKEISIPIIQEKGNLSFLYDKVIIDNGKYCGEQVKEQEFSLSLKMKFQNGRNQILYDCFLLIVINLILMVMLVSIKKKKTKSFNLQEYKEQKEFLFKQLIPNLTFLKQ